MTNDSYCSYTMCQWDRIRRGRKHKRPSRRPRFAIAWHWRVIDRQYTGRE